MAAFSYQQHNPFHLDSVYLPNSSITTNNKTALSGFMEEGNNTFMNTSGNYFSQIYPPLDHSSVIAAAFSDDNEPSSVSKKQSTDSSTVVDKLESGEQVTQKLTPLAMKRKSSLKDGRSKKQKECNNNNDNIKEEDSKKPNKAEKKDQKKVPDQEPPTGYIHVRARRGQATDSHSLAERVRREKISERMKILQRLVPGCDKVTGKALMLDEIINYVQSLQNQVEFLSMKLASVNPLFYDFEMDLDTLIVRPEGLSSMPSSLPHIQQCTQPTALADATIAAAPTTTTTTFAGANNYPLIDTSSTLLLQGQRPSDFIQDTAGSLMWDVDEQRQKFLNPTGFSTSVNLCSASFN